MSSELTIQQVAARTGLSTHTLRYYERVNLIPSVERAANGHRRYSEEDLDWIEFVKCLRSTGMPISDVQRYVELQHQGDADFSERLKIVESHRHRLKAKIEELSSFLARIEGKLSHYREHVAQQKIAARQP
jgi:DNA-binding transcriptional MerR regulator